MNTSSNDRRERGFAMLLVMGAVAIAFVIGMVLLAGLPSEAAVSRNLIDRERAVFLAESGLAEALHRLMNPPSEGETWAGVNGRAVGDDGGTYDVAITDMGDDVYQIRSTGNVAGANGAATSQQIEMVVQLVAGEDVNFDIVDSTVTVNQPFAAKTGIAGVEIADLPVTVRIRIGDTIIEPYGNFNSPVTANVNANGDYDFVVPEQGEAGETVTIEACSWDKKQWWYSGNSNSHYEARMTVSTAEGTNYVKALRNGDTVPDITPASGQAEIGDIVSDFVDPITGKVKLADNQVIYLFELYTTDLGSEYADFQDLVLLVTFAGSTEQLETTQEQQQSTSSGGNSLGLLGWVRKTVDTTVNTVGNVVQ